MIYAIAAIAFVITYAIISDRLYLRRINRMVVQQKEVDKNRLQQEVDRANTYRNHHPDLPDGVP